MNKEDFSKLQAGRLVKLKTGEIVKIEFPKLTRSLIQGNEPNVTAYEVTTTDGTTKDISIDEILAVISTLQKIWLFIKGLFKKQPVL